MDGEARAALDRTIGSGWRSSGTVWEVGRLATKEQTRNFRRALIEVVSTMRGPGVSNPRAEPIAGIFEAWEKKSV